MHFVTGLLLATTLTLFASIAHAATVERVDIRGLDEAMTTNVRVSLSLTDAIGKEVSGRRLAYLVQEAEAETREALEPFGYYAPVITVTRDPPSSEAAPTTGPVAVTIDVRLGEAIRVRRAEVGIAGDGNDDRYLKEELAAFQPQPGALFDHTLYEGSKARISRRLAERGYFDADFLARKVEVTRAANAADIDLRWNSGDRYDMGAVTFTQAPNRIIREDLLGKLIYWNEGDYYHQGRLDRLRKSLVSLDYFSRIDIEPQPENATPDKRVPVQVTLTPAKRSIYTAGLSYGTDSGGGVILGVERRYLNDRGHKALAQLDYAQRRKTLTLQYRIPAFAWLDGWYTGSLQAADEQTDYIDTRRLELVGSRSGEINQYLTAIASLHTLRERWAYTGTEENPLYRYATFTFPSLRAEYIDADDRMYPRDALGGTLMLRGGVEGAGSDASFAQLQLGTRWFKGLGDRSRLLVRGEVGHTYTDALVQIPPSLRFYAGGDRSVRGYAYREIGPRITGGTRGQAFALGAKNMATASVEYEQYFSGAWGGAVFVDSGTAFDDRPEWRTGIGVGLRWKSPVGPVRVDLAHGLDDPDSSFQLHINIGADL
ncbi:MAG: autotransporter assembly complex protein TamA [Pseudomonadota bacterium]|nr:autotransporter assembly complex protein TamA [Pseudomonadota bacterium]